MDDKKVSCWAVGCLSVDGLGEEMVQHCLWVGCDGVALPMVK
jgi:hypothetical protein